MKFIHIADVHLGATPDSSMPWGEARQKELWGSFKSIIKICNEEKIDLLLIAGDLFHKQPLLRELKEVNYYFSTLETARVVIMAGNHDYIGSRSNYRGFEWDDRVHMFLSDRLEVVNFPDINTSIYGFSYLTRDITEPKYDNIEVSMKNMKVLQDNIEISDSMKTFQDNIETRYEIIQSDEKTKINILLAHGGDDRSVPINRKKLLGSGFDYIALGHIHKPEIISNIMAYSGSLEPLDKNETGQRGYILGRIKTKEQGQGHEAEIDFVNNSVREYKRLTISVNLETTNGALLDQIKDEILINGDQHIYQLYIEGFRDENIHFDKDAIYPLGNIREVIDESTPDYDFDKLYRENADNMIGMFIEKIRESSKQDDVARKALYYGIEALLGAKEN